MTPLKQATAIVWGCLGCSLFAAPSEGGATALRVSWEESAPLRSGPHGGYSKIIRKASPGVVSILVTLSPEAIEEGRGVLPDFLGLGAGPRRTTFSGDFDADGMASGVILTSDGYVLTNSHVVEMASAVQVGIEGRDEPLAATVVGFDAVTDIALLKVDAAGLPAATLGRSAALEAGDVVLAIGNPFGLDHTVTSGIVSAPRRKQVGEGSFGTYIQMDAAINPGSSGGALIDNRGCVVGINSATLVDGGGSIGIGFAVPIESAVAVAQTLLNQGEVVRGYVGIAWSELTPELADAFDVSAGAGAIVAELTRGAPAEKAGVRPADVVLAINGAPVSTILKTEQLIAAADPGALLKFDLVRFGEKIALDVPVVKMPLTSVGAPPRAEPVDEQMILEGVTMVNLERDLRIYFGTPLELEGVIVIAIEPGSPCEGKLSEGDVIVGIDQQDVASLRDAATAREAIDSDKIILRVVDHTGTSFVVVPAAAKAAAELPAPGRVPK